MMPFDLLDEAFRGTRPQWIVLVILLPFAGRAVARSWGPAGTVAAQRALLLVAAYVALALLLALPVHAGALIVATLPLAGAAVSRRTGTIQGAPLAWAGAVLFALPAVTLSHLGPRAWAGAWFIGLFGLMAARGVAEPLAERLRPLAAWLRRAWRRPAPDAEDDAETTVK